MFCLQRHPSFSIICRHTTKYLHHTGPVITFHSQPSFLHFFHLTCPYWLQFSFAWKEGALFVQILHQVHFYPHLCFLPHFPLPCYNLQPMLRRRLDFHIGLFRPWHRQIPAVLFASQVLISSSLLCFCFTPSILLLPTDINLTTDSVLLHLGKTWVNWWEYKSEVVAFVHYIISSFSSSNSRQNTKGFVFSCISCPLFCTAQNMH